MQAIILSGGLGKRLSSVSDGKAKALMDIAGKPFIAYQIEYLVSQGINQLIFALGHKSEQIIEYLRSNYPKVLYSVESELLGTGGAIKLAVNNFKSLLEKPFFVLNGDSLIDADYLQLMRFHERSGATATVGLVQVMESSRYGTVTMEANDIVAFDEKEFSGPGLVNTGIYILNKESISDWPENIFSIEKEFFPAQIGKGLKGVVIKSGYFIDMGTPDGLRRLEERIIENGNWYKKA